jgi:hypothetical protein
MSRPSSVIAPEAGVTSPAMVLSKVDLPAPLRPSSATISPLPTSRDGSFSIQYVALAEERIDGVEAQDGCGLAWLRAAACHRRHAAAGVDLLHARVAFDLLRRSAKEDLALIHHGDALREAEHAIHVVLHDQHWNPAGDARHQTGDALALRRSKAGQRLVEQKHVRLRAESDAEIDVALSPIGEVPGGDRLDAFEAEKSDEFARFGMIAEGVDIAPAVEPARMAGLNRQAQVLVDSEAPEDIGDLKRAGEALPVDLIVAELLNLPAPEPDDAAIGRIETRYEIEQGRLAGAVGTDQGVNLAGMKRKVGPAHRLDPTEPLARAFDVEDNAPGALGRITAPRSISSRRWCRSAISDRSRKPSVTGSAVLSSR